MRAVVQDTFAGAPRATGLRTALLVTGRMLPCAAIFMLSAALLWLVWIYGNGLRDPRYLDGWILAGGMGLQLGFHIAVMTRGLSPGSVTRFRRFHIYLGYLLIVAFVSHSDFSLPDSGFEWSLWAGFVLVTLSGIWGTYLAWFLKARQQGSVDLSYDRIPAFRAGLLRDVQAVVARPDAAAARIALPGLPHDAWIAELYATRLKDFFQGTRNVAGHLVGSKRPLKRLTDEIDNLSVYVDRHAREKLAVIKGLVIEKDRLDFMRVHHGLNRGWLFVHVPATYALFVLSAAHVIVVYAFSSGAW